MLDSSDIFMNNQAAGLEGRELNAGIAATVTASGLTGLTVSPSSFRVKLQSIFNRCIE